MKKNIKLIIIIVSFLILLVILYFPFKILLNKINNKDDTRNNSTILLNENLEINVYDKIKLSELITIENGTLLNDGFIDTSKLGKTIISYSYLNNLQEEYNGNFTINIVDKIKPYIGISKNYTYVIGNEFDLETSIFCGDNYTKRPKCHIEGEYNLTKVGEYPLVFIAEDEGGNINSANFNLKVVTKKPNSTPVTKISFEEIEARKPKNASLMIDVSKWQGDIDWEKIHNSGIEYAMLRVGTQIGVDQESKIDSYFEKNIEEAKKAGVKIGVYYYSYANDKNDALIQAKWVIDVLEKYSLDLPVAFDWECWSLFNSFNINFHDLNEIANTFLETIKIAGYKPLLYGSKNYMENVWNLDYDIWLAHYTDKTSYSGDKIMWQFTSSGEIPGIKGNADVNFYYNK